MEEGVNLASGGKGSTRAERHAEDMLELFYPVHYRGNRAVEEAMRGELSRQQAAILWLIRSAGNDGQNRPAAGSLSSASAPRLRRHSSAPHLQPGEAPHGGGLSMRRKEIVQRLQDWFDVSSPAVTQALRRMARPPMNLVCLIEDAESAREKRVILTTKGQEYIRTMADRGHAFLQRVVQELPGDRVSGGIEFLRAAVAAVERVHSNSQSR
jgi:DNA-binding MarR family transcriptional regulator